MGCTDQESNFQYIHYDPATDSWWCSWGYTPVYAAPKGYENVLAAYVAKQWKSHVRFKASFNSVKQMWEVRPIREHRKDVEPEASVKMCKFCGKRPANDSFSGNSLLCGVCYYDL